jgi:hypothetical protein
MRGDREDRHLPGGVLDDEERVRRMGRAGTAHGIAAYSLGGSGICVAL